MSISVVIPTYNNGRKLAQTLDRLLDSDTSRLGAVEVIVVDDGSPEPAESIVTSRATTLNGISLRYIRQHNAGPAAARNTGFRVAKGDLVIFIDDDILVPSDLIRKHFEAHLVYKSSVICGRCPYVTPSAISPAFRYVNSLNFDPGEQSAREFTEISILASGQVSFEREMFDLENGVYCDDLATPAAEEYELSLRLRERRIPILRGNNITAQHNHEVLIKTLCQQGFKHGVGCGEVAIKRPQTRTLKELDRIIVANQSSTSNDSFVVILKKALKRPLAGELSRRCLLKAVSLVELATEQYFVLKPLYGLVLRLHFFAGVRAGLRLYGANELVKR